MVQQSPLKLMVPFFRTFPLIIGTNVINAQAMDQAGNITTVEYTPDAGSI